MLCKLLFVIPNLFCAASDAGLFKILRDMIFSCRTTWFRGIASLQSQSQRQNQVPLCGTFLLSHHTSAALHRAFRPLRLDRGNFRNEGPWPPGQKLGFALSIFPPIDREELFPLDSGAP